MLVTIRLGLHWRICLEWEEEHLSNQSQSKTAGVLLALGPSRGSPCYSSIPPITVTGAALHYSVNYGSLLVYLFNFMQEIFYFVYFRRQPGKGPVVP